MNGRQGQVQDGVDIYGLDNSGRFVGVQCKQTCKNISLVVINNEIIKAECFQPEVTTLYIATTSPRDSKIQRKIRILSQERIAEGKFPVALMFWDDLIQELIKDPSEFSKHYPQIHLKPEINYAFQHTVPGICDELDSFVERFKKIYIDHNIELTQIPRFWGMNTI